MRSPNRQLQRVVRSAAKKPRAFLGGFSQKFQQRLRQTPKQKSRLIVFGVDHRTGKEPDEYKPHLWEGKPNRNIADLMPHLRKLKEKGVQKVGVELLVTHPPETEIERYFYALQLRLRRIKIQPVSVEDPVALKMWQIGHWSFGDMWWRVPSQQEIIRKYFFTRFSDFQSIDFRENSQKIEQLISALSYFRSLQMYNTARRLGLNALVIENVHMDDLVQRGINPTRVNPKRFGDNTLMGAKNYRKYRKQILRLWKDLKTGKVKIETD